MQVRKKQVYNIHDSLGFVTAGLYFPNGILYETASKIGIGNFVDIAIFERLSTEEFSSDTRITGHTYYHYSEFLLTSPRQIWKEEFVKFTDIILHPNINCNLIETVQNSLHQDIVEQDQDIDDLYNEYYYRSSRLSKPIAGTLKTINLFSIKDLLDYQKQYYVLDQATLCITGTVLQDDINYINDTNVQLNFANLKDQKYGRRGELDTIIVETDWNDSDILMSFDCPEAMTSDFLVLEIFCCICQNILNRLSCQFDQSFSCYEKPKLYLDYGTPRIIFKLATHNNCLGEIFQSVFPALEREIHRLSPTILNEAISEVVGNYDSLIRDPAALNLWMGWNSMIGDPYDLKLLPFNDALCRGASVKNILQCFQKCICSRNATIALTNNPAIISDIEIRMVIREWRMQFS